MIGTGHRPGRWYAPDRRATAGRLVYHILSCCCSRNQFKLVYTSQDKF